MSDDDPTVLAQRAGAAKIAATTRALGLSRFDLKYSAGSLPHGPMMRSIDLFATEVAPRVHELLGTEAASG